MKDKDMYTGAEIKGQTQEKPGREFKMEPEPIYDNPENKGYGRLKGKVAIVTGGDSGIGRAVSVAYAKEGATVVIVYNIADKDANDVVKQTIDIFGKLDILVNNAAVQYPQGKFEDITDDQLEKTFKTNIFSMFYLSRAALPFLIEGSSIINTSSVTAYKGNPILVDYSSSKGAITSFTRSLSTHLAEKKIRVNQIAPGPIWTPLIPSTFNTQHVETFGENTPLKRPGQPVEVAEAYVFLASDGASYITGQSIHINGGEIVNG